MGNIKGHIRNYKIGLLQWLRQQNYLLSIIIMLAFAFIPLSWASEQSSDTEIKNSASYDALIDKARAEGKIRVIVGLKTAFVPEGNIKSIQGVNTQRVNITSLQDSLLASLSNLNVTGIRKFKYIPFIALEVDETALLFLISNPLVSSISEDGIRSPLLPETIPLIGADVGESLYYTGTGQAIAILDTGVDKTHPFLSGKVVEEACYSSAFLPYETSLCPNGQSSQLESGAGVNCPTNISGCEHGTHVAGIAAGKRTHDELMCSIGSYCMRGVAPDANIIAIQVFHKVDNATQCSPRSSPCTSSSDSDYTAALEYVYELRDKYKIASVNMSLGEGWYPNYCDSSYPFPLVKAAIDNLRSAGIATVIASGNDYYLNGISAPACISTAVSVGATNMYFGTEKIAGYSNSSSILSLLAPGGYCGPGCIIGSLGLTGIYSSIPGGRYGKMSGTSMAAPHVAGAWAVLKQKYPSASVDTILSTLQSTGIPFTDTRKDSSGVATNITKKRIKVDAALSALPLLPNLTPYKKSGWADKIVISTMTNATTDSSIIYDTDNIYINWAVADYNADVSTSFYTKLYIDGLEKAAWPTASLKAGYLISVANYNIGMLSGGTHSIKIVTDANSTVSESDESDNGYSKTIIVTSQGAANNCIAAVSSDGSSMYVPVASFEGSYYWGNFVGYFPPDGSIRFKLIDVGLTSQGNCSNPASLLTGTNRIHFPDVLYEGVHYWADCDYYFDSAGDFWLKLIDYKPK